MLIENQNQRLLCARKRDYSTHFTGSKVIKGIHDYRYVSFQYIWACRSQHAMTKTEKSMKKHEGIKNEHKE